MTLEQFPQSPYITPRLGVGMNGKVYAISNEHAAKVSVHALEFGLNTKQRQTLNDVENYIGRSLIEEYEAVQELHNAGLLVPKPEGVYSVTIRWLETAFGLFYPEKLAFVMERVHGIDAKKTKGNMRKRVEDLITIEVERCRKLGYEANSSLLDVMYDQKMDRIFFVDSAQKFRRI